MKILSFGEIIWDIYPDRRTIGGAPLNFAAHAVKNGANAYLVSAVGNDEAGTAAIEALTRLGIDARFVARVNGKETGACKVRLDENGLPCYELLSDVAYDYIPPLTSIAEEPFDVLAFGTLAIRSERSRAAFRALLASDLYRTAYCDLNLRAPFYDRETIAFCLRSANIVKMSEDELFYAAKEFSVYGEQPESLAKGLTEMFPSLKTVLITLGENGSFAYEKEKDEFTRCGIVKTTVVSTVGAGDSFGATFLTEYLRGKPTKECLQAAAKRSAFVVAHEGAIPDEE